VKGMKVDKVMRRNSKVKQRDLYESAGVNNKHERK
jgi:hypothetical protein